MVNAGTDERIKGKTGESEERLNGIKGKTGIIDS
jgi:hypothetical protein